MLKTTQANLNKGMGVVLIEKRRETVNVGGRKVTRDVTDEQVINLATIRGVFSNSFEITGMTTGKAHELAVSGTAAERVVEMAAQRLTLRHSGLRERLVAP